MHYCRFERYNRKLAKNGRVIRTKYYSHRGWLVALLYRHQMRYQNNSFFSFKTAFLAVQISKFDKSRAIFECTARKQKNVAYFPQTEENAADVKTSSLKT